MESNGGSESIDRIGALESEVRSLRLRHDALLRRSRRIAWASACSIAVLVLAGAATVRDRLTALEVIGPNNDVRVAINVNPVDSGTGINLFNVAGNRVLLIGVDPQGVPEIVFFDPTGQRIVRAIRP